VIAHELLHCHTRDAENVIEGLDGQIHRDALAQVEQRHEHAIEQAIERLSHALVRGIGLA
jgi:hypothetical protein